MAGLARARANGRKLGRPKVASEVETAVLTSLATGKGVVRTAREIGCGLERSSAFGARPAMTLVRVRHIPHQLPEGIVSVINHGQGSGFQAWIAELDDTLVECPCVWGGVDLHGLKHYIVRRPKSSRLVRVK